MSHPSITTSRWARLLAAALITVLALPPRAALALHTLEPTESTTRAELTAGLEQARATPAGWMRLTLRGAARSSWAPKPKPKALEQMIQTLETHGFRALREIYDQPSAQLRMLEVDEETIRWLSRLFSQISIQWPRGATVGLEEQGPPAPPRREFLRAAGLGAIGFWFGSMTGQIGGQALAWRTADPTTTTFLTQARVLIPDQPVPVGMHLLRNPDIGPSIVTLHWSAPRSAEQMTLRAELEPPGVGRPVPVGYNVLYMEVSTVNLGTLRIAVSNGSDPWTELPVKSAQLNTEQIEPFELPVQTSLTHLPGQPSTIQLRFRATPRDPRHPMELSFGALAEATRWPSPFEQKAGRWGRWGGGTLGTLGLALGAAFGLYGPQPTWRRSGPLAPDELERLEMMRAVVQRVLARLSSNWYVESEALPNAFTHRQRVERLLRYASSPLAIAEEFERLTQGYADLSAKAQRLIGIFRRGDEALLQRAVERLSQALPSEPGPPGRGGLEESAIVDALVPPLAEALAARGGVTVTALCDENTFRSVVVQLLLQQAARHLEIPWLLATSGGLSAEAIPAPAGVTPQPASREAWMKAPTPIKPLVEGGWVDSDLIDAFIPEDHPIHDWQPLVRAADLVVVMESAHRETVEQALSDQWGKVRLLADLVPETSPLRTGDDPFVKGREVPDTSDPTWLVTQMPQAVQPLITALERVHADAVKQARQFLEAWGRENRFLPRPGDTWRIDDLNQGFEFEMRRLGHETIPAFVEHAHSAMIAHDPGVTTIHLYAPTELLEETRNQFDQQSPARLPQLRFQVHDARELESGPPARGTPWLLLWPGAAETTPPMNASQHLLRLEGPLAAYARTAVAAIAFDPTIATRFLLAELRVVAVDFAAGHSRYVAFFV